MSLTPGDAVKHLDPLTNNPIFARVLSIHPAGQHVTMTDGKVELRTEVARLRYIEDGLPTQKIEFFPTANLIPLSTLPQPKHTDPETVLSTLSTAEKYQAAVQMFQERPEPDNTIIGEPVEIVGSGHAFRKVTGPE